MLRWEIAPLRAHHRAAAIAAAVDQIVFDLGLDVREMGSLKHYPGSRHWHVRRPGRQGTVEITFWPEESRLWVTVHRGREGSWAEEGSRWLAEELARRLGTTVEEMKTPPSQSGPGPA